MVTGGCGSDPWSPGSHDYLFRRIFLRVRSMDDFNFWRKIDFQGIIVSVLFLVEL